MRNSLFDLNIKPEIVTKVAENLLKLTLQGNRTTIDTLAAYSTVSRGVAYEVVARLLDKDFDANNVEVADDVKLTVVLKCIRNGAPAEILARYLSWKNFEALSAKVLREYGFDVLTNLRLQFLRKRCEIDVLAARDTNVLLLDCKRWNAILSGKRLSLVSESQMRRARMFSEYLSSTLGEGEIVIEIIPAILTLYGSSKWVESGVAVVPIEFLGSFVEKLPEVKYNLKRIKVRVSSTLDIWFRQQREGNAPQRPYGSS
jgi:Holliday junction resolvase-like predicted endonuclease